MFIQQAVADARGIKEGFRFFGRGAHYLWMHREHWGLLVIPLVLNTLLFTLFIWGAGYLIARILAYELPTTWWAVLLGAVIFVVVIAALIFLSSFLFVFVGSIMNAPFYDTLAQRITRAMGGVIVERSLWQEVWRPMKHAVVKFAWYVAIQAGLLVLFFIPVAVGPIAYVTLGYFVTAFFVAFDFIDYFFDFRGMTFSDRQTWCKERKGVLLGFGAAILIGMMLPGVNLLVPPIAIAAAALLFNELDAVPVTKQV